MKKQKRSSKKLKPAGFKVKFQDYATAHLDPDLNEIMPIDDKTPLGTTASGSDIYLSFQQLEIIRGYFGQSCTLLDVRIFVEQHNLKFERVSWTVVLKMIEQENPRSHKGNGSGPEWSKIMSKIDIATKLGLSSTYKLDEFCKGEVYEIRPAGDGRNRQAWEIRIDKLSDSLQKKFRP